MSNKSYGSYKPYNILPNKRLGQNFLIKEAIIEKLLGAADIKNTDTIIEVGAGLGIITKELARRAERVIAVEKDERLITILKKDFKNFENLKIVHGDILKLKIEELIENSKIGNWKLIGNIPYYLTSPLIRKFLESPNPPKSLTFMAQKEVAQRIAAKPPNMSILAVSVQIYADTEIISYVPRSAFWPQPKVDSAIIKIKNIQKPSIDTEWFFKIVKAGFQSPRKQLINNLSKGLKFSREDTEQWLKNVKIEPRRRAETLSVQDWKHLSLSTAPHTKHSILHT